jgi:hypothetical protein
LRHHTKYRMHIKNKGGRPMLDHRCSRRVVLLALYSYGGPSIAGAVYTRKPCGPSALSALTLGIALIRKSLLLRVALTAFSRISRFTAATSLLTLTESSRSGSRRKRPGIGQSLPARGKYAATLAIFCYGCAPINTRG